MPQADISKFILRLLDSLKNNEDKIAVVDQNGQRQTTYKELLTMACRVIYSRKTTLLTPSSVSVCPLH